MATKADETASAEALREDIQRLQEDMAAIASTLKQLGAESGNKVYERVREEAARARGEAQAAAGRVERQIEEKPLTAVLTALLVGAILGALLGRR